MLYLASQGSLVRGGNGARKIEGCDWAVEEVFSPERVRRKPADCLEGRVGGTVRKETPHEVFLAVGSHVVSGTTGLRSQGSAQASFYDLA